MLKNYKLIGSILFLVITYILNAISIQLNSSIHDVRFKGFDMDEKELAKHIENAIIILASNEGAKLSLLFV